MSQKPTVGRIVHYVLPDGPSAGQHRPAIIVRTWDQPELPFSGTVQLQVFTDGQNDVAPGEPWSATKWISSATYSEEPQPRTWHWPERE
ncbi:MAG TPA: hypothetical protein DC063_04795 [Arenimonas sp.]|nr:hypothetical protein [Arenimonas sp.]